jgi:hypothetical protein
LILLHKPLNIVPLGYGQVEMPLQVFPFFAETKRLAAQAAHDVSHGEIHTLYERRVNGFYPQAFQASQYGFG